MGGPRNWEVYAAHPKSEPQWKSWFIFAGHPPISPLLKSLTHKDDLQRPTRRRRQETTRRRGAANDEEEGKKRQYEDPGSGRPIWCVSKC
jgi:hypothetical protein